MKSLTNENQFNHMSESNNWQDLPELELFDDELSFIKKDEAESLTELESLDELGLSALSSINPAENTTPTQSSMVENTNTSQANTRQTQYLPLELTEKIIETITNLTEQVSHLNQQIQMLQQEKQKNKTNDPQKLFSTGVYHAKNKDYLQAAKWFRRAALAGHAKAMFYLGTMFIKAEGLPQSLIHSYVWMTLANIYGATEAKAVQQDLQKRLTAKELNLAQRLAADKYEEIEDGQTQY